MKTDACPTCGIVDREFDALKSELKKRRLACEYHVEYGGPVDKKIGDLQATIDELVGALEEQDKRWGLYGKAKEVLARCQGKRGRDSKKFPDAPCPKSCKRNKCAGEYECENGDCVCKCHHLSDDRDRP